MNAHTDATPIHSIDDKPLTDIAFSNFELHPAVLAGLDPPASPAAPRSRR